MFLVLSHLVLGSDFSPIEPIYLTGQKVHTQYQAMTRVSRLYRVKIWSASAQIPGKLRKVGLPSSIPSTTLSTIVE